MLGCSRVGSARCWSLRAATQGADYLTYMEAPREAGGRLFWGRALRGAESSR